MKSVKQYKLYLNVLLRSGKTELKIIFPLKSASFLIIRWWDSFLFFITTSTCKDWFEAINIYIFRFVNCKNSLKLLFINLWKIHITKKTRLRLKILRKQGKMLNKLERIQFLLIFCLCLIWKYKFDVL